MTKSIRIAQLGLHIIILSAIVNCITASWKILLEFPDFEGIRVHANIIQMHFLG